MLLREVRRPGSVTAVAALVVSIASLLGVSSHYGLTAIVLGPVAMLLGSRALDRITPSLGAHRWRRIARAASRIGLGAMCLGLLIAILAALASIASILGVP